MINLFSRLRRLQTRISLLRWSDAQAYGNEKKSILLRRVVGRGNEASAARSAAARRHISQRLANATVQSDGLPAIHSVEKADVAAFRSDLELMLASMSTAPARNLWRSDGADNHVSDLDSALENDVADAVRRLSIRALGV